MLGDPLCLPWLAQGRPLTAWTRLPGSPEGTWVWFRAGSWQLKTDGILWVTAALESPRLCAGGRERPSGVWDLPGDHHLSQWEPRPLQLKGEPCQSLADARPVPTAAICGGLWPLMAFDT